MAAFWRARGLDDQRARRRGQALGAAADGRGDGGGPEEARALEGEAGGRALARGHLDRGAADDGDLHDAALVGDGPVDLEAVGDLRPVQRVVVAEVHRVGRARPEARGDGEEKDIVIAEDCDGRRAEFTNVAQHLEGVGSTVDEVADKPEAVLLRIELNGLRELRQGFEAALDVTDCIGAHDGAKTNADRPGSQVMHGASNEES